MVVYAGVDPVTGKRVHLRETIKGTTDAARKRAEKALTKLLNQVNEQNSAPSTVALSYALSEWLRASELEESTRHTYEGYIRRTILPVLGETAVNKISARMLESFYSELRHCRARGSRSGPLPAAEVTDALLDLDAAVFRTDSTPGHRLAARRGAGPTRRIRVAGRRGEC
ncbi:N-terminal phage integrase SAM-like domain-containing protein [Saccharopolyspora sp. NPDC047091]|uniref:N-terminal phage integrase SAM-like domain-containing protein n=1 Tax=Saccharopolyspora sp. NPDC047091 TaxID=3155924 RepID=UPI0033F2A0E5